MKDKSKIWKTINWIFAGLFILIGILNFIYVHFVPCLFYLAIALLYLPQTNQIVKSRLGWSINPILKIVIGFLILWGTLGVGDLMEVFEARFL